MTSEDVYRILLKAYPQEYRHKYEEVMAHCFRDQVRAANTVGKWLRLWLRVVLDLALSVPGRHLERVLPPRHRWTEDARRAIFFARREAASSTQVDICLEHLLIGALRSDSKLATVLLGPDGFEKVLRLVQTEATRESPAQLPSGALVQRHKEFENKSNNRTKHSVKNILLYLRKRRLPGEQDLPLSSECKVALEWAFNEAHTSDSEATPRHIVRAILHQEKSVAARLLRQHGDTSRL
jgi:hypothetical protein